MTEAASRLARLLGALGAVDGSDLSIQGMCEGCASALMVRASSIVLMVGEGLPATTSTSDPKINPLEDIQFSLGAGPTFDAYRWGVPVVETDLIEAPPMRWTEFSDLAVRSGMASVFSFPLQIGAARLGALTLYQSRTGALGDGTYADALVMAGVVTRLILALQAGTVEAAMITLSTGEIEHADVHQASGMVSAQLGIGVGEALDLLRARAFSEGVNVRTLAADVISRQVRFFP